nr:RagB/SusD family nutrient uptake outer membrane protein [uncultured Lacibacter sp.]
MKKIVVILFAFSFVGCSKDFTERESLTQIAKENFWKSEQDAQLAVNGIYDALQDRALYSGNLNATAGLTMFDCFGDNLYNNYKWEGPGDFMIGIITPSNALFSSVWSSSYKGIARANAAIENIQNMSTSLISQDKKDALFGQALFLRALFYFNLGVYFQDVPLITKVQTLEEAYVVKNTYQEVNAQVIADLTEAVNKLPVSYPATQYGYATKGAALGLLARVHLYNKNYQGVVDATGTLLTLGYTLNTSYAQLFTEQGELSKEIIFSVRFNQDVSNNGELFSATFTGNPAIDKLPMPNLVKDYYCTDGKPITQSPLYTPGTAANNAPQKNNRDPRLTASVYFRGDIFLTDLNRAFATTPTTYGLKKYIRNASVSAAGIGAFSPGGQDFIVIRYADVLLMRAEALVELNQLTEVYSLVNQVRQRVSMPTVQAVEGASLTQAALRDVVRHERRVELAFEGLRYFDLKRWGDVQNSYNRAKADNISGYIPIYLPGKSEVFPIPLSELNVNSNLVQNTVWQ